MNTDQIRKSLRVLVDEIVTAQDALGLPVDPDELADVRTTLDRIERRMRSHEPLPQPDPKKFADFAEG